MRIQVNLKVALSCFISHDLLDGPKLLVHCGALTKSGSMHGRFTWQFTPVPMAFLLCLAQTCWTAKILVFIGCSVCCVTVIMQFPHPFSLPAVMARNTCTIPDPSLLMPKG